MDERRLAGLCRARLRATHAQQPLRPAGQADAEETAEHQAVRPIIAAIDHVEPFGEDALGADGGGRSLAPRFIAAALRGVLG